MAEAFHERRRRAGVARAAGSVPLHDDRARRAAHAVMQVFGDANERLRTALAFDDGVRIAAHVVGRTGATTHAMAAEDYDRHARAGSPPVGTDAPWDPRLSAVMAARGVAVAQEQVCDELLDAMARPEVE